MLELRGEGDSADDSDADLTRFKQLAAMEIELACHDASTAK